ncbi:secreted protein [Phakopsora pachyrhizi]|uniref:Secreted protein n=1 Tax=Phakopsora pachyrhizi TaxID=170000 RepID=A0AAV0AEV5_PHAPC|nr:secreted protein [Phakopsora pachyrhizi]
MFSLTASILILSLIARTSAHLSLLAIYGSNNVIGRGFGVNTDGKYPRKLGRSGDAGGDSTVFETGTDNPSPACGRTPELGELDIPAWLSQAEGEGLPAAYSNGSIVAEAFQVNRDGGGPMSCEYNQDATATSWKSMFLTLNQAGNSGIYNVNRFNSTVVINFPQGAKCTGGWTGTACIVRCRTGVNKRFGGCFAAKLSSSNLFTFISKGSQSLSDAQLDVIAQKIVSQMKLEGLLVKDDSQSTNSGGLTSRSSSNSQNVIAYVSHSKKKSATSSLKSNAKPKTKKHSGAKKHHSGHKSKTH